MPGQTGQKDQALITGRIGYGYDGANAWPFYANSSGNALNKTVETELLGHTAIAASSQQLSSVLSLVGIKKVTVFIDHGRAATTAFGTIGTEYRIEASQKASGNDTWVPMASVVAGSAVASSISASADEAAGQTVIETVSATTLVVGDLVYWANSVTISKGEWARVVSVAAGTSITIQDGLTNAQDSDTSIFNKGERFVLVLGVEALTRMRVVVNNNNSGTTVAIQSRIAAISEK